MIDTDAPTIGDRYALATSSSDLTMRPGRCDADKLLAAAYAARRDARGLMALSIYRMRLSGDRAEIGVATETAMGWLIGRGVRAGGRNKINRAEARNVAESVLQWWLDGRCDSCEGRRYDQVPGTPHLSANLCRPCGGTGTRPLERVLHRERVEQGRWLASELDGLLSHVMADMARRLNERMDVARGP